MKFKEANPDLDKRVAESSRVRTKHKGKVPIICERDINASGNCPTCSKEKFLAQETLTCGKFILAIRKQLNNAAKLHIRVVDSKGGFFCPADEQLIGEMDCQFRDRDGYLYVLYSDTTSSAQPEATKLQTPVAPAAPPAATPAATPAAPVADVAPVVEPAAAPAAAPAEASEACVAVTQLTGLPVKCVLVITAETWVWSMTDPHWEFSLDVMPAKDESGMPVGSCSKRYSDFQQLENFVCAELGEAAWANMPKLPAAHTIPGVGKLFDTAEVAQQRRADLNTYLQDLLSVAGASESDSLIQFLTTDEMAQQLGKPIALQSTHEC